MWGERPPVQLPPPGHPATLRKLISLSGSGGSASGSRDAVSAVGAAPALAGEARRPLPPPCKDYANLRTFGEMAEMANEYEECLTSAALKAVTAKNGAFKIAGQQLKTTFKRSVTELNSAKDSLEQQNEQSQADDRRRTQAQVGPSSGSKKQKKGHGGSTTMNCFMEHGAEVSCFPYVEDGVADSAPEWFKQMQTGHVECAEPYCITGIPWVDAFLEDESSGVQASFTEFKDDFAGSGLRNSAGRAVRANLENSVGEGPGRDFVMNKCSSLHPKKCLLSSAVPEGSSAEFKGAFVLSNFAIKKGTSHVLFEKCGLWTGRLSLKGTRYVVCVRSEDLQGYLRKSGIAGIEPKMFFRDIREEGINKLVANGIRIWYATVGKANYLWVPSGMIVREAATDECDVFGLRYSMVAPHDKQGAKHFMDIAVLPSTPAMHAAKAIKTMLDV